MSIHPTKLTLEYWRDGDWYVGQLREVPGVLSQGSTLRELEENIQDAYQLRVGHSTRTRGYCQITERVATPSRD